MDITLLTSFTNDPENSRLQEEAAKLGHTFRVINTRDIELKITDNGHLDIPGVTDLQTDIVINRSILNNIKNVVTLNQHFRSKGIRVFENNLMDLQYSINKVADLFRLSLAGLPLPNTRHTRDYAEFERLAQELGYPVIIKPTCSGKGIGVTQIKDSNQLEQYISQVSQEGHEAGRYLIQQYIPYQYDLRVLIIGPHIYTMRRIPRNGDFRANFSLGGTVELFNPSEEIQSLARKALRAVGMSVAGVDVLITPDGKQYILEVNHNPGFLGMEKATNENIGRLYLENAIKEAE